MRILLLADMHIGAIKDISYYYNTMTNIIDQEVTFTHCDMVVILGDYFDRLFKANEDFVGLAINVMSYLVRVCIKSKTKIRIVYGTESHEMNQYKLFNHFLSSKSIDMKVFTTCTGEVINGKKILYVPEEYISDKYEFYKNTIYGNQKYDYIFGHGVITEGMPAKVGIRRETDTLNTENKVPYFNAGELSKAGKLVVFGHYHRAWNIGNVYYLGSLFRSCFGEEEPKRYGIIEDDQISFIENKAAYEYKTYVFEEDDDIFKSSTSLMDEISKIKSENKEIFSGEKVGKIRLEFHMPAEVDPNFRENLKAIIFNDKILSSLIKESISETEVNSDGEVTDEFDFVLDNSMKVPDKIYTYNSHFYESPPISIEDIEHYINDELKI